MSSFAYESNFHFSTDMMHFARVFPPYGMSAFEVFSYGTRTRVVMRNDFTKDYDSFKSLSSVGPFYTITWDIERNSAQNTTITVNTDEKSVVLFDLATASFYHELCLDCCEHYIYEPLRQPKPPMNTYGISAVWRQIQARFRMR